MGTSILVVSDNVFLAKSFHAIVSELGLVGSHQFHFACSHVSPLLSAALPFEPIPMSVKDKDEAEKIARSYQLVISAHCKQLFPAELVRRVRCINIHPGLNPHNRGWFPQVFSIFDGTPLGATIHVIDEQLDHGPIIARREVPVHSWDTSLSAYERVLQAELVLVREWIERIIEGAYEVTAPEVEGKVHVRKDYEALCRLDLAAPGTLGQHLDLLRALTHEPYANAHYLDPRTGRRVFVSVAFRVEVLEEDGEPVYPVK